MVKLPVQYPVRFICFIVLLILNFKKSICVASKSNLQTKLLSESSSFYLSLQSYSVPLSIITLKKNKNLYLVWGYPLSLLPSFFLFFLFLKQQIVKYIHMFPFYSIHGSIIYTVS